MKKTSILLLFFALSLVSFKKNSPVIWTLDPMHSQLKFAVSLFGLSDISGTFKFNEATITEPKDDFSDATVTMIADINSIDTDNDERDKHLRTADFFDGEKFPTINFKSSSFKKSGDGSYKVTGDLSFHGITKPVTLNAIAKTGIHPVTNKNIAGFKVTGVIKRSDFGISPASPPSMLSDDVFIEANLQFIKN